MSAYPSSVNCARVGPAGAGPVQFSPPGHSPVEQIPSASQPVRPQIRPEYVALNDAPTKAPAARGKPPVEEPSDAIPTGKNAGSTW